MTENKHIYQAMFLLDNQEVRKSYAEARDWIRTTLEKHGAEVSVLRLWAERELAYPIERKNILAETISRNPETINNIRLWDHRPYRDVLNQVQFIRLYYNFPDVDVDRYTFDGE